MEIDTQNNNSGKAMSHDEQDKLFHTNYVTFKDLEQVIILNNFYLIFKNFFFNKNLTLL